MKEDFIIENSRELLAFRHGWRSAWETMKSACETVKESDTNDALFNDVLKRFADNET